MDAPEIDEYLHKNTPGGRAPKAGPGCRRTAACGPSPVERPYVPSTGSVIVSPTLHIVDDDTVFLAGVRRVLKRIGCTAHTFASTDEALARFVAEEPDLIFVDVHMPRLDGTEFLQRALGSRRAQPARVFLDSAGPVSREVREWCVHHGVLLVDKREMLDRDWMHDVVEALRRTEPASGRSCRT